MGAKKPCACGCTHNVNKYNDHHNNERGNCKCSHFVKIENLIKYQQQAAIAKAKLETPEEQEKIREEILLLAKARKRDEPLEKILRRFGFPKKKKKTEARGEK